MPNSLSEFIAAHKLESLVLSEIQTDGLLTALAITPHLPDPSQWLPYFWGNENDAPFTSPPQLEQYANILLNRCDLHRQTLLSNQWCWPKGCTILDQFTINTAAHDYCEAMLLGWSLTRELWAELFPEDSAESALLGGVLLSISLLVDSQAALEAIGENGDFALSADDSLTPINEIFDGMPMMLCGLSQRAIEFAARQAACK